MGITAVISNAIVDSTATGRALITAANAAAGRDALEILDASYDWTGAHYFEAGLSAGVGSSFKLYNLGAEGDANTEYLEITQGTFTGYGIYANATGSGAVNSQVEILTNARKSGSVIKSDSVEFYANLSSYAKLAIQNTSTYTRQDFRPYSTGNYSCGTTTYRWSNVASVDGDFSGTVTVDQIQNSLGDEGIKFDANYGYLTASNGGANVLRWASSTFEVYGAFNPRYDNISSLGSDLKRWANVYSVDGDFSGDVTIGGYVLGGSSGHAIKLSQGLVGESQLRVASGGGTVLAWGYNGSNYAYITTSLYPSVDGSYSSGKSTNRWSNVFSVDGSFTGTLDTEVGGSMRLFNLGSDADVAAGDTEYVEMSWNNYFQISTERTGSGAGKGYKLIAGTSRIQTDYNGNVTIIAPLMTILGDLTIRDTVTTAGLATGVQTITAASDTLVNTDHTNLCDCTSNAITINLPAASAGQQFVIKKIDASANAVTIDGNASETIDGALTATLTTQYESITLVSDGSNWFIT
jgi:hypothetical protein